MGVLNSTWRFLEPLREELKRLRLKGRVNKPVGPSRYLDRTKVTYADLHNTLEESADFLSRKLEEFRHSGRNVFIQVSPRLSARSLPEIVLEALLISNQPQSDDATLIGEWLDSACQIRERSPNPRFAHINNRRLSSFRWMMDHNLNPTDGLRVGFVACISAAYVARTLYTSSTLIN